jgi:hypothetical protein
MALSRRSRAALASEAWWDELLADEAWWRARGFGATWGFETSSAPRKAADSPSEVARRIASTLDLAEFRR